MSISQIITNVRMCEIFKKFINNKNATGVIWIYFDKNKEILMIMDYHIFLRQRVLVSHYKMV